MNTEGNGVPLNIATDQRAPVPSVPLLVRDLMTSRPRQRRTSRHCQGHCSCFPGTQYPLCTCGRFR